MKKKILLFILSSILVIGLSIKTTYAIEETPHLEVTSATATYSNNTYTISGALKVLSGYDGQSDYLISVKDIITQNNIVYTAVSVDIDTDWYENEQDPDYYDYDLMREEADYLSGVEGLRFHSYESYDANTEITFEITFTVASNYQAINDCKANVHVYQYTGYSEDKCFNVRANAYVGELTHKAVIEGRITFDSLKPYATGWYLLDLQCFVDYYNLDYNLGSITITCAKKAIKDSIDQTLIMFNDNNSCYFFLPNISNAQSDIIEFTALFGGDVGGTLVSEVQSKIKLTKMSDSLAGLVPANAENTYSYSTSVDDPIALDDLVEVLSIVAIDDCDGDITNSIEVSTTSNYTTKVEEAEVHNRELGDYSITISATDSHNNTSQITVVISVIDNTKPVITLSQDSVSVGYSLGALTEQNIRSYISVTDNYYTEFSYDIDMDDYTANYYVVGAHAIDITVTDGSGNYDTAVFTINVTDDVAPVFNAVNEFRKSPSTNISAPEIAKLCVVSVRDEIAGVVSYRIVEDNYTLNANTVGSYTIKLRAVDPSGNSTDFVITVVVEDGEKPYLYIQGTVLVVGANAKYNPSQIFQEFVNNGTFSNGAELIEIVEDNYTNHSDEFGIYAYSMRVREKEEEKIVTVNIKVDETVEKTNVTIKEPFINRVLNKLAKLFARNYVRFLRAKVRSMFNKR